MSNGAACHRCGTVLTCHHFSCCRAPRGGSGVRPPHLIRLPLFRLPEMRTNQLSFGLRRSGCRAGRLRSNELRFRAPGFTDPQARTPDPFAEESAESPLAGADRGFFFALSASFPWGRNFTAWECKVTPVHWACQEGNTIGCICNNDGLDAGCVTGFPHRAHVRCLCRPCGTSHFFSAYPRAMECRCCAATLV
jgi:hypothetical protein